MANKIIIKNGNGTPPSGALDVAELGIDLTNKKVYIGHSSGNILLNPDIKLADLGIIATAEEINIMDGVTATATELNYVKGATSNIQTQLNTKISGVEAKSYTDTAKAEANAYTDTAKAEARAYTDTAKAEAKSYTDSKRLVLTAVIAAENWSIDGTLYVNQVAFAGLKSSDMPHITPSYNWESGTPYTQKEAWDKVSYAVSLDEAINFVALEDFPTTDIPIQIEVIR